MGLDRAFFTPGGDFEIHQLYNRQIRFEKAHAVQHSGEIGALSGEQQLMEVDRRPRQC